MDLEIFWFVILGVLLTGYAILDGFDLGVGIMHLTTKDDTERRLVMNSIGPLWDGNEVWLVTFGGALFAAFPHAYATALSGFYLPFMFLLFALIFRAVSMEFRSKQPMAWWRRMWDVGFCASSSAASFLFGFFVGNSMRGIPIGADKEFAGNVLSHMNFYAFLVGFFTVSLFAMHGTIYLYLKTEGELQKRFQRYMWSTFGTFMVLYIFTTIVTLVTIPHATESFKQQPILWGLVLLNVLAVANIPRAIYHGNAAYAFASSCATIAALVALFGAALFPNLLVSSVDSAYSLTVYNAASSQKTLGIMRFIALLGIPFVLAYTAIIYWTFRGKTKLDSFSY
ncbi:MAG: cytochrome d ubiquinol oxidase subunit II [Myxococcota bacterium]